MREYGLAGNMHFRFLHLIKQVLKSTRYTTGGRCSVSAQAPGAASAVPGLEGGSAASHGRRRPPARSLRLGERAIPTQEFSMGADAPWCGSTSRLAHGRDAAPSESHTSGAASAVLSHAGRRDASPTSSRGSAAGNAVVPDSPLPCSTGVVRLWSAKPTPPGPLVIDSSRRSAASPLDARLSSLDSSPSSVTRHSRFAASDLLSFRRSAATRHQLLVTRHSRPAASYHE